MRNLHKLAVLSYTILYQQSEVVAISLLCYAKKANIGMLWIGNGRKELLSELTVC